MTIRWQCDTKWRNTSTGLARSIDVTHTHTHHSRYVIRSCSLRQHHHIGEAIPKIPDGNTKRYVISIQAGTVVREKVFLGRSKPLFVTFASSHPKVPAVIAWNDTAATEPWARTASPWEHREAAA